MAMCKVVTDAHLRQHRQRMSGAHHADKTIAKQRLNADLGAHLTEHAYLEIDQPFTQRLCALFGAGNKAQTHVRCARRRRHNQRWTKGLNETLVSAQHERALQRRQRQFGRRGSQQRQGVKQRVLRAFANGFCMRR